MSNESGLQGLKQQLADLRGKKVEILKQISDAKDATYDLEIEEGKLESAMQEKLGSKRYVLKYTIEFDTPYSAIWPDNDGPDSLSVTDIKKAMCKDGESGLLEEFLEWSLYDDDGDFVCDIDVEVTEFDKEK